MRLVEDIRNVAIVGHKGVGKTSLVEAMLYLAKATPRLGRAGDRASGLDDTPEEKAHAATLETRAASLRWQNKKINVLDTPGEASFAADARLALAAADAAIVCVSARDGVETGTERALRWVREAHLPCVVVLTKMDDDAARPDEVVDEVRAHFKTPVAVMELPHGAGHGFRGVIAVRTGEAWVGAPESPARHDAVPVPPESKPRFEAAHAHLVDDVAATDDTLTEHYLNDGDLTQAELDAGARAAVRASKLVPLYEVASTMPSGIAALLDAIVDTLPPPSVDEAAPPAAIVFKTHVDPHAGRISYVRVVSGTIATDPLVVGSSGQKERASQILQGTGKDMKSLAQAVAGDIVALTKLKTARSGDTLADEKCASPPALPARPPALFSRALAFDTKGIEDKAVQVLSRLAEEDPGLAFAHEEQSRALVVSGVGAMHLDVTLERLKRRASIACTFGPPRVAYRETIRGSAAKVEGKQKKQSGGHGQFAVCVIDVAPAPRGAGLVFEDAIVGGVVPRQFIASVEKGVRRAMEHGTLAGYPVVDIAVRLVDGKTHSVDSSDAAFQVAGFRALRAALAQASPCVLEPIAKLEITIPPDSIGDVIGDLNGRHGKVLGTDDAAGATAISALVPLAATLDYEPKLTALTHGRGVFAIAFDHYDYCSAAIQDKVIAESGYKQVVDED